MESKRALQGRVSSCYQGNKCITAQIILEKNRIRTSFELTTLR